MVGWKKYSLTVWLGGAKELMFIFLLHSGCVVQRVPRQTGVAK